MLYAYYTGTYNNSLGGDMRRGPFEILLQRRHCSYARITYIIIKRAQYIILLLLWSSYYAYTYGNITSYTYFVIVKTIGRGKRNPLVMPGSEITLHAIILSRYIYTSRTTDKHYGNLMRKFVTRIECDTFIIRTRATSAVEKNFTA